jgi:hypothetical protein
MLTKLDIAAIRKADDLVVHLNAQYPDGVVRLIKRVRPDLKNPFAHDVEHKIESAKVELSGHRGRDGLANGSVKCFAMIGLYHGMCEHASGVMKTLRAGDEVTFKFYPDAHTNGYLSACGLHGDALYLQVRRKGKTIAKWHLDESICPPNSARMCSGVPKSEHYDKDGAEARKNWQ